MFDDPTPNYKTTNFYKSKFAMADDEDDDDLHAALALSMQEQQQQQHSTTTTTTTNEVNLMANHIQSYQLLYQT